MSELVDAIIGSLFLRFREKQLFGALSDEVLQTNLAPLAYFIVKTTYQTTAPSRDEGIRICQAVFNRLISDIKDFEKPLKMPENGIRLSEFIRDPNERQELVSSMLSLIGEQAQTGDLKTTRATLLSFLIPRRDARYFAALKRTSAQSQPLAEVAVVVFQDLSGKSPEGLLEHSIVNGLRDLLTPTWWFALKTLRGEPAE